MRVVIQRVIKAGVSIDKMQRAAIENGLLVFAGIEDADTFEDIGWISNKIVNMRIFNDEAGVPNISLKESNGDLLLVSQFTLHASTKKGNRPGYSKAAKPEISMPMYEKLIAELETCLGKKIFTGEFGADMKVSLVNDGPVTILIDSKDRQ